jgi:copper oxidase (laccase) domain-containing protein
VSGFRRQGKQSWATAPTTVLAESSPEWATEGVVHAFAIRQPSVPVDAERSEAVERLGPAHASLRAELGLGQHAFCVAEQVHGAGVAVVKKNGPSFFPAVDSLVTDSEGVCLGIYTADCCAVFLVDPGRRAIALAHAGAKGTRLGVVRETVDLLRAQFGCEPTSLRALLSPCIRPPLYEWDFAAEIRRQLSSAGVGFIVDSNRCTGAEPDRYYSYRVERGRTGRMLALLALA